MNIVKTRPPSFPEAMLNGLLSFETGERWQVLCGDEGHWRLGIYSPPEAKREDIQQLEKHDCPELFLLLSGKMTLLVAENGAVRELELLPNKPALITVPHNGYCPNGPHTGVALVIERDSFDTEYRSIDDWLG